MPAKHVTITFFNLLPQVCRICSLQFLSSDQRVFSLCSHTGHGAPGNTQRFINGLTHLLQSLQFITEVYNDFLGHHGWVFGLTCSVNCGTLVNCVQSIQFATGKLHSTSGHISRTINHYLGLNILSVCDFY